MHPQEFTLTLFGFGFEADPYTLAIGAALFAVMIGSCYAFCRAGITGWRPLGALLIAAFAAFIGARLLNGLLNPALYEAEPWRWLTLHATGFSLYGGIIAALGTGYLAARVLRLDLWRMADLAAPSVGIGIALIRFGCYLRGCCFGVPTELPWGVTFPLFSQAHLSQLAAGEAELLSAHAAHPTQLYELAGALLAAAVAWTLGRKKIFPDGVAALSAAAIFTLVRLITYFFRVMPETYGAPEQFYPLLYVAILAGLAFLIWFRLRGARPRRSEALA